MRPIACLGGLNLDRKLWLQNPLALGSSNPVQSAHCPGGVAYNVASHLQRQGAPVRLLSIVGQDADGQWLLDECARKGLRVDCLQTDEAATGHYLAVLNPDGGLHAGFADMGIYDHLRFAALAPLLDDVPEGSWLFVDCNVSADCLQALLAHGGTRWHIWADAVSTHKAQRLPQDLSALSGLFCNRDELAALSEPCAEARQQAEALMRARKLERLVVTLGPEGVLYGEGGHIEHLPTAPARVLDATGAGDALCAETLRQLHAEQPLAAALVSGQAAALHALQSPRSSAL